MTFTDRGSAVATQSEVFTQWLKQKSEQLPALFVTGPVKELYPSKIIALSSEVQYLIARAHALHLAAKDADCPDADELAREMNQALRFVTVSMYDLALGYNSAKSSR
ncbi:MULTISPECIES: hypothetical protein [Pseudomonas]|uniref:hypothetical protein n=1 Tax=Pseudomonas TaxID=286 RepID=UPI0029118B59|nr:MULTISPECIES: hypothetical protein [Pseudomonas]MDU8545702.1 hypothetical protein [Pseudomonas syringae group sp. J248-6]WPP02629.1 hypothetical protein SFA35_26380 [Pseudomonas sp. HR96]